jgi:ring-1,2-phenylacetyl-CoA epoxidase subunit PaaE
MIHFHKLTVKEVRKETNNCVSIAFEVPEPLAAEYTFEQGQNLTLKTMVDGEELRRSYSICTAPYENELRVAVKKVEQGKFSTWANEQVKKGDVLEVLPPTGKFNTPLNSSHKKNYLAFAAGSGITPIISIIKTTLQTEPQSSFTLVYGNRSRASIIFFEELAGLKNRYPQRFTLIHILSREKTDIAVNFGRINTAKLEVLGKAINYDMMDEVFICGPEELIFCTRDFLEQRGFDKRHIHFELFAAPGQKDTAAKIRTEASNSGPSSRITVKVDERSFDFNLGFDSDSILDAAMKQGADLPFACKGGVCCTCKARLLEGEVEMEVNYGLEHEEVEQGFILACQARPITEKVVVDFDIK